MKLWWRSDRNPGRLLIACVSLSLVLADSRSRGPSPRLQDGRSHRHHEQRPDKRWSLTGVFVSYHFSSSAPLHSLYSTPSPMPMLVPPTYSLLGTVQHRQSPVPPTSKPWPGPATQAGPSRPSSAANACAMPTTSSSTTKDHGNFVRKQIVEPPQ